MLKNLNCLNKIKGERHMLWFLLFLFIAINLIDKFLKGEL